MGLYQKLLQLQEAVKSVAKDAQGNGYPYVSGDKLLGVVRPLMDKFGLILITEVVDATFSRQDYATQKGQKSEMFCALKMKFTWVDAESKETKEVMWASSGMNQWDKSIGSAMTYGERYFIMKQLHLATDEDDVDRPRSADEELSLQQIIAQINGFTTQAQMEWAWKTYAYYHNDKDFKLAFAKRQKEINDGKVK